jgi:hypothetical protein
MQPILVTLFTLLLLAALVAWYVQVYRRRPSLEDDQPSYLKRESLLLDYEQRYFATLAQVVGSHARVFPKVRLSDFIQPQGVNPEQRAHWMRVQRRCVDFLLCSPNNLAPVLAIDLDTRAKKRRREASPGGDVLDKALRTANIPLLRVRATREYDPHEVLHQIRLALAASQEPVQEWFSDPRPVQQESWWRFLEGQLPTLSRWTSGLWGVLRRA